MAKTKNADQVYQLKITLRDIKPPVWRRVQVTDCTLAKLNDIIQACMGWSGSHLHAFEIGREQYGEPDPDGMMETEDSRKMKLSRVVSAPLRDSLPPPKRTTGTVNERRFHYLTC